MTRPVDVLKEIRRITETLVEKGLCDDQNMPALIERAKKRTHVSYDGATFAGMFEERSYTDYYLDCLIGRNYNLRLLDGALVQMNYEFYRNTVTRHRLAFFPSPALESYQNDPDVYIEDVFFAEVVEKQVVAVPIRFDFDSRESVAIELLHPKSHLTLGQYTRCRIPASAPLTPAHFVDFLLRSFYNTKFNEISIDMPTSHHRFMNCSSEAERGVVHIGVPCVPA